MKGIKSTKSSKIQIIVRKFPEILEKLMVGKIYCKLCHKVNNFQYLSLAKNHISSKLHQLNFLKKKRKTMTQKRCS